MTKLSTRVTTHEIHYDEGGGSLKSARLTEQEAAKASKQWQDWRPVPVPNRKDNYQSEFLINPKSVIQISRYRRI